VRAYLLIMALTAVVTLAATWVTLRFAHKYKLYLAIRDRDAHTRPTPRLGGIAMYLGLVVAVAAAGLLGWFHGIFVHPEHITAIVVAGGLITAMGVFDDLYDLDWFLKLAGQFLVAGLLAWQGVAIVSLPIAGVTIGSFGMSFVVTVFLTVLVMNAVNFIDGLDGLVAGVVLIGTTAFFGYSYLLAQQNSPGDYFNIASLVSAIVIGMCLGFLPLNWRPAKIFMGDSGALLLGMLMATTALTVTGQIDPANSNSHSLMPAYLPLILPLAILVLPLLDFVLAVLRRLRAGKSPFSADRKHIHHKLQDFGHSHLGSVLVFYAWTTVISLSCILVFFVRLRYVILFAGLGGVSAMLFTVWPILPAVRRRKARRTA
jgi:UDP-GlcNAc:undecaprenyl-phosphate GlcNAc-1-phosphate transferase